VAAFRGSYRCLTYDARGFGASDGSASDPAHSAANDLLGLLDHVGIERAFLIGHSMGGQAVSGVAQAHPERVRALVMSDSPFGFQTAALSRWAAEMLEKIPAGFNVFDHLFAPGFATREPELHYLYTAICRLNAERQQPRATGDYLSAYIRMRDAAAADYSALAVPSLFVVGDQDGLTLPWLIEGTAAAVRDAELAKIAGAGHSAFYERSAEYNHVLNDFLGRVRDAERRQSSASGR
jgi:pimeloyl-ACP methyl ester carboxylesterase